MCCNLEQTATAFFSSTSGLTKRASRIYALTFATSVCWFGAKSPADEPAAVVTNAPPAVSISSTTNSPIDFGRARALMQKARSGATLTPDEQDYLNQARQEMERRRAQMGGSGSANARQQRPGMNADMPGVQPGRPPDKTVVFKKTPQGELKLYEYLPPGWKATDKLPVIVFWFGGGFAFGTPSQFYRMAEYLSGRGMVCICPDYRVKNTNGAGLDKSVEDARSAMRWVKVHHAELGIDPERVIASGGSAGGTLSLLMALGSGPDAPGEDANVSPRPSALVLFNPAQGQPVMNLMNREGEDRDADVKAVSPLNEPQKGMPPAIFFFGTADRLLDLSRGYCEKSIALGDRCEVWSAAGMSHGFFNREPWQDAVLRKTDEFLTALGYLNGQPQIVPDDNAVLKRELPK
jgi:acetyl esterase/lipase